MIAFSTARPQQEHHVFHIILPTPQQNTAVFMPGIEKKCYLMNVSVHTFKIQVNATEPLTHQEISIPSPDRTNTQGLKITEENVLPL